MSAIAGILNFNQEPVPYEHGRSLMSSLEKYPSDSVQTWQKGGVFLGCHAQWITPESVGEKLPYFDEERQLAITADAIIDNRDELFERLQVSKEYRKIITDSELILLSYYKWGEDSPKYLIGDFSFMIWDEKRQRLFGARDFSGTRTLYYFHNHLNFAFCTTMGPLFSLPYINKELNEEWLAEFIAIPGMHEAVDVYSSVYKHIKQVPPAHSITVVNNKVHFSRYIMLSDSGEKLKLKTNEEYEEAFREVFNEAVTSRLRTHHKVGAHLSGGLDSGSVASFAARNLQKDHKKLYTYSYVPVDNFIDWTPKSRIADERPFIKSTVDYVGNIHDRYYSFEGKSALSEMDDWLRILEAPYKFFENSFWLKGMYEEANRNEIGVLLNGNRGNYTISWGSALDYQSKLFKNLKWLKLYGELEKYSRNRGIKKSKLFPIITKKAFPFINKFKKDRNNYAIPSFINPSFAKRTNVFEKLLNNGIDIHGMPLNAYEGRKKQLEQLFFWGLTGTTATKLSLHYSLMERDPTNDLRIMKFCLALPDSQFVQDGLDRALIRRSTKGYLPNKVRLNQKVRGVQGADGIQRLTPEWPLLINELDNCFQDSMMAEFLDLKVLKDALINIRCNPIPELVFHKDFKILMRSLVLFRFMKASFGGR
ncbi:asparagine synthase-related protein [Metabacillus arenae]|uniref:asparagine synthase (glutamine-hydrolyzing) n=1 Tax=Metabacillus arenae TaxID=2771434 RepID=A0A926RVT8_9BACI|nr:asparagine synthase-related protein [Metabacillus arenae]MBD1378845.1 asparagine synthetase B [Metabacillus arenae]